MTDFRDDPAFLRDEAKRQATLATGAMREADMLRVALDFTRAERDQAIRALRRIDGLAPDQDFYAYARGIARGVLDSVDRSEIPDTPARVASDEGDR